MHIAAIMDGNRRWAKIKGWKKVLGHKTGIDVLKSVLDWCPKYNVDVFTIYALSTENLKREQKELDDLFDLIEKFAKPKEEFVQKNIKVHLMGNLDLIRPETAKSLEELERATQECTGLLFQVCLSYGGRAEIVSACKKIQENGEEFSEETISQNLYSSLEPDLIIRTGGHKRLSNFLPWQGTYTDLLFLDKYWPEFNEKDLEDAVKYFKGIQRNFGK